MVQDGAPHRARERRQGDVSAERRRGTSLSLSLSLSNRRRPPFWGTLDERARKRGDRRALSLLQVVVRGASAGVALRACRDVAAAALEPGPMAAFRFVPSISAVSSPIRTIESVLKSH